MNGATTRSHFSLRLHDVSPEVRRSLWKHVVASFAVSAGTFVFCIGLLWWLAG